MKPLPFAQKIHSSIPVSKGEQPLEQSSMDVVVFVKQAMKVTSVKLSLFVQLIALITELSQEQSQRIIVFALARVVIWKMIVQ